MAEPQVQFNDGDAYERMMGIWSRLAGNIFLDWLAPHSGLRWIDIGCGNGASTELIVDRFAPTEVQGVDPSEAQLAFARTRPAARVAKFRQGEAMSLPFSGNSFDAAVMALVIFFVSEPAQGVAEMARVVMPGGTVAAYAWDMMGDGFPAEPVNAELRAMNATPMGPPRPDASRMEALRQLWTGAGFDAVETREIVVQRTFVDFDDLWSTTLQGSSIGPKIASMSAGDVEHIKAGVCARLPADAGGHITYAARANAVKGRVPS